MNNLKNINKIKTLIKKTINKSIEGKVLKNLTWDFGEKNIYLEEIIEYDQNYSSKEIILSFKFDGWGLIWNEIDNVNFSKGLNIINTILEDKLNLSAWIANYDKWWVNDLVEYYLFMKEAGLQEGENIYFKLDIGKQDNEIFIEVTPGQLKNKELTTEYYPFTKSIYLLQMKKRI